MFPKVSVVIPTYNSASCISKCLDSVLCQSYINKEIIVVDGLSSDNTINLVKKFSSQHACIRLISERDVSIYDAMNKGIKIATGDWLYFLGSDDYLINKNVFSRVFATDMIEKYFLIYGDIMFGDNATIQKLKIRRYDIIEKTICHQAIFYNKKAFEKLGYYNTNYKMISDWIKNVEIILNGYRFKHIDVLVACFGSAGSSNINSALTTKEFVEYRKKIISSLSFKQYVLYKIHNQINKFRLF